MNKNISLFKGIKPLTSIELKNVSFSDPGLSGVVLPPTISEDDISEIAKLLTIPTNDNKK